MRELLRFLWFPSLVVSVTLGWLWLDRALGWRGPHSPVLGWLFLAGGALLVGWCTGLFSSIGQGTPNPFEWKTQRLVIVGPYRYVRNPMMWGVGALLVGLALLMGSRGLWFGLALFVLFAALFVPLYEERDMERRFGEEYREYCRRVPRWFPRLW